MKFIVLIFVISCQHVPIKDREFISLRIMKWNEPKIIASIHGSDVERGNVNSNVNSNSCVSCSQ